jgi:hypothetical protein
MNAVCEARVEFGATTNEEGRVAPGFDNPGEGR